MVSTRLISFRQTNRGDGHLPLRHPAPPRGPLCQCCHLGVHLHVTHASPPLRPPVARRLKREDFTSDEDFYRYKQNQENAPKSVRWRPLPSSPMPFVPWNRAVREVSGAIEAHQRLTKTLPEELPIVCALYSV